MKTLRVTECWLVTFHGSKYLQPIACNPPTIFINYIYHGSTNIIIIIVLILNIIIYRYSGTDSWTALMLLQNDNTLCRNSFWTVCKNSTLNMTKKINWRNLKSRLRS